MGSGERGEVVYSSVLLPGYGNFNINVCRPIHVPLWFQPYSLLLPKQYTNDGVWDTQKNGSSLTGTATAGPRRGGITTTTATTGQRGGSLTHTAGHEDGTPPQAEVEHGTVVAASFIQQAMQTATPPQ